MAFRVFILAVFAALVVYLVVSLALPFEGWVRGAAVAVIVVPYAAILTMVFVLWRGDRASRAPWAGPLQWTAFLGMGLLSFLLVLTVARDVAGLFLAAPLHTAAVSTGVLFASVALLGAGFLGARCAVAVKEVEIPLAGLPAELAGFRIVQLSDVHISTGIRRDFIARIVALANGCAPDVVVLTGDIADGPCESLGEEAGPFADLRARYGKFYVTGNHEYYWGAAPWVRRFAEVGLRPLENEHALVRVGAATLLLAGVPDRTAAYFGGTPPDLSRALQGAPSEATPRLLLSHQTKIAPDALKHGFDLLISGHTHGGQFFPWTLVLRLVDRFAHGIYRLERLSIYVSRGTGYWGPPLRLGAPAEVTLIRLVCA